MSNVTGLVVGDRVGTGEAALWNAFPECEAEVFFLPAESHVEKEGRFTKTQRML